MRCPRLTFPLFRLLRGRVLGALSPLSRGCVSPQSKMHQVRCILQERSLAPDPLVAVCGGLMRWGLFGPDWISQHFCRKTNRCSPTADSSSPIVAVMQPAQALLADHLTISRRTRPASRCLLFQPEVRAVFVIVRAVIGEKSLQIRGRNLFCHRRFDQPVCLDCGRTSLLTRSAGAFPNPAT